MNINVKYTPFGMTMPGRSFTGSDDYRYGFSGKEKDDEVKGEGNSFDFGARMYDPRVGRWMIVDPKAQSYSGFSPYNYAVNSPLMYVDILGEDVFPVIKNIQNGLWDVRTIHDLAAASYMTKGLSLSFNTKTNEYDLGINFQIEWHNRMNLVVQGSIEHQNPGLYNEVKAHEESHVDQFFYAAVLTSDYKVTRAGTVWTGGLQAVVDAYMADFETSLNSLIALHNRQMKEDIENGVYKTQAEVDIIQETFYSNINKLKGKAMETLLGQLDPQIQDKILEKYDKQKLTEAQVQQVEDGANKMAAKKLGGTKNMPYLTGKKKVKDNDAVVPSN